MIVSLNYFVYSLLVKLRNNPCIWKKKETKRNETHGHRIINYNPLTGRSFLFCVEVVCIAIGSDTCVTVLEIKKNELEKESSG